MHGRSRGRRAWKKGEEAEESVDGKKVDVGETVIFSFRLFRLEQNKPPSEFVRPVQRCWTSLWRPC